MLKTLKLLFKRIRISVSWHCSSSLNYSSISLENLVWLGKNTVKVLVHNRVESVNTLLRIEDIETNAQKKVKNQTTRTKTNSGVLVATAKTILIKKRSKQATTKIIDQE